MIPSLHAVYKNRVESVHTLYIGFISVPVKYAFFPLTDRTTHEPSAWPQTTSSLNRQRHRTGEVVSNIQCLMTSRSSNQITRPSSQPTYDCALLSKWQVFTETSKLLVFSTFREYTPIKEMIPLWQPINKHLLSVPISVSTATLQIQIL